MSRIKVNVGGLTLGGGKIVIQSMLNKPAGDIEANVRQARELEAAGCGIIRAAVPKPENAELIKSLKAAVKIPVVADIHFDYRAAVAAANAGADKIRINPGNIGSENIGEVINACRQNGAAIRVGVNGGSLEKDLLAKYGVTAEALSISAARAAEAVEKHNFGRIIISVKSSDVIMTIETYRMLSKKIGYPLHVGVTEAGTSYAGLVKSAIGIGSLLADGIGDTIRVSLTSDPAEEIRAAKEILAAVGKFDKPEVISCPTCGRTNIDVEKIATSLEAEIARRNITKRVKIAVMGCAVNGPGEAREADFGIAGGIHEGVLFRKGVIIGKIPEAEILGTLLKELDTNFR